MERLWILDPVQAWLPTQNYLNRLAQLPKQHLADPALAVSLLGFDEAALLKGAEIGHAIPRSGLLLGRLYESLITQSLRVYAQAAEAQVRHLRLHSGTQEVDLIIERSDRRLTVFSNTPLECHLSERYPAANIVDLTAKSNRA